ncbi:interleukin-15 isoform X2 [Peromyscus eremicus]|uniref:interleukin-15 isoform X2 n=1 Tax=Peromyscus eremicus TaxID=42410 RepID=UPI0027DDE43E|nr:interleukin-15 isoform X2 [Peromyscus eremicus]
MKILKPYMRNTSISCYLCFLLNSHFLTEVGIHVFIWGCVGVGLPKTEANWEDVLADLNIIKSDIQSIHIDVTLYTDSDFHVILHEYSHTRLNETVNNVMLLMKRNLSSTKNITESGCKECEELEEKNIREFVQSFIYMVQMFINTS